MSRWDVAREVEQCYRCTTTIIEGEQLRRMGPRNLAACVACAKTATCENPPADMPMIPLLPTLKEPEQWYESELAPEPNIPALASTNQRARIQRARRRLEAPPPAVRDWWND